MEEAIPRGVIVAYSTILVILLVVIIGLIVRRIDISKKEDFEKRDN